MKTQWPGAEEMVLGHLAIALIKIKVGYLSQLDSFGGQSRERLIQSAFCCFRIAA